MIKNFKIEFSPAPIETTKMIRTVGDKNLWRVYFESTELEDQRETKTETVHKIIYETITWIDDEGVEHEEKVPKEIEVEEEITTTVYENKFVEVYKDKTLDTIDPIQVLKEIVVGEITDYDTSAEVNGFYLNDNLVWLDKDTRVGLMNSTTIQMNAGVEESVLWLGTVAIKVAPQVAIQLLSQLEIYALACFNVTAEHKKNVLNLTEMLDIVNYDYTLGYPEKLNMTI